MRNEISDDTAAVVAHGLPGPHSQLNRAALYMPVHGDVAEGTDCVGIQHRLGAQPAHDLMKIEVDHGGLTAQRRLSQHGTCGSKIAGHRFFSKHRLAQFERADGDLCLQAWQCGYGDRLDVFVFNQCAPVAVGLWYSGCPGEFGRARGVASAERDHLAAWVGTERRQLYSTAIIAADDAQTDHCIKTLQDNKFTLRGMDLSQIYMLRKGELGWVETV